jgi:hypothetical protein
MARSIPFAPGNVLVEPWLVDRDHSNSYRAWQKMNEPQYPTQAQWEQMKAGGELQTAAAPETVTLSGNRFTKRFPLKQYSVALINVSDPSIVSVQPASQTVRVIERPALSFTHSGLSIDVPGAGLRRVTVFDMHGRCAIGSICGWGNRLRINSGRLLAGAYVLVAEHRNGAWSMPFVVR